MKPRPSLKCLQQTKEDAGRRQQDALIEFLMKRDSKEAAYDTKEAARKEENRRWRYYRYIQDLNDPLIAELNDEIRRLLKQEEAECLFARIAREDGYHSSARTHKQQAKKFHSFSQQRAKRRRRLADEINTARREHEVAHDIFMQANNAFEDAGCQLNAARKAHQQAQDDFKKANDAYRAALERSKANSRSVNGRNVITLVTIDG